LPVAVLIVNFRVYDDLDRALASLATVLEAGDEIAVVDQASDRAALARIGERHPRARLYANDANTGFAAGVNQAARLTSQAQLFLLNPDAILENDAPRILAEYLARHPDVGVAGPRVLEADGSIQASARRFPGPTTALAGRSTWLTRRFPGNPLSQRNLPGREATDAVDVDWLAGSCFMTPRAVFERAGGFDEQFFMYWEDADYCARVARLGLRRTYVPAARVRHVAGRSAALDAPRAIRAFHASAYRMYRKHGGMMARVFGPAVHAGLWLRGEVRARRAARVHAHSGTSS